MNRYKLFERITIVAALTGLVALANADNMTTLPPVRVVASNEGNVVCYGYDCADILNAMAPPPLFLTGYEAISDQTIDHGEFCRELKTRKPADCNASNPPSTPGTDPNWQPNGCGTNEWTQIGMDLGINLIVPDEYSGDHNSPYAGVSFESACNRHDACWGSRFHRGSCDDQFHTDMRQACSVVSDSAGGVACDGLAGFYFGAVASTNIGTRAHQNAFNAHKCAVWAKDMGINGCPQ